MLPHSQALQVPCPSDHFVAGVGTVFIGRSLPQDGGVDQSINRVGEWQSRFPFVALVSHFDADCRRHEAAPQPSADLMEGRLLSVPFGSFEAVGRAGRGVDCDDHSHGSLTSEGFADDADQRDCFDFPAGEFAKHFDHRRSGSDHDQHRVVPLCLHLAHARVPAVVRCGHFATEVA